MSEVLRSSAEDGTAGPLGLAAMPAADGTAADPIVAATSRGPAYQPLWMVRYRIALVTLDLCCMIVATVAGYELRFGFEYSAAMTAAYVGVGTLLCIAWVVAVQNAGGYDVRHLADGTEEAKRVLRASAITVGTLTIPSHDSLRREPVAPPAERVDAE